MGRTWSFALLACGVLASCRPSPSRVGGDTVTVHRDDSGQLEDTLNPRLRLARVRQAPVRIDGPTLIAVSPRLGSPGDLSDPEVAAFIRDFQVDLSKAERIAAMRGLVYEQRDGPIIRLEQPFTSILTSVSVGDDVVGFVIVAPGMPPFILRGHVADSVLFRAIVSYQAAARRQIPPSVSGS